MQLPGYRRCPLNGSCLVERIAYRATVEPTNNQKMYIGSIEGRFKKRLYNHKYSFQLARYRDNTKLASYVWKVKKTVIKVPF